MKRQVPGSYDPRPSSRAGARKQTQAMVNKSYNSDIFMKGRGVANIPVKTSNIPGELKAGAVSKKAPQHFHIHGIPVRPLSQRALRHEPPASRNGRKVTVMKTEMQKQREQMVGTSDDNPPFMRLPYNRPEASLPQPAKDRPAAVAAPAAAPVPRPSTSGNNRKVHITRYYEQASNVHSKPPGKEEVMVALKQPSRISTESPSWMHIPQVPIVHDSWKKGGQEIVVQRPTGKPPKRAGEATADESCVSESAPTWMHIKGLPTKKYRKPEPLSVRVSFNNAESAAFGQKHPINFHYLRQPHKQEVDQDHKREYTECGNFHKKISHHSAVSAKAPEFFHVNHVHKAKVLEFHHQKGAHMRNMRPTTSGGVHTHKPTWRHTTSSVSYDTPDWMKTHNIHIVNGPIENIKMIAGKNNQVLVHVTDKDKIFKLREHDARRENKSATAAVARKKAKPAHQLLSGGIGERHLGAPSQVPRSRAAARRPSTAPKGGAMMTIRTNKAGLLKNGKTMKAPPAKADALRQGSSRQNARPPPPTAPKVAKPPGETKDKIITRLKNELERLKSRKSSRRSSRPPKPKQSARLATVVPAQPNATAPVVKPSRPQNALSQGKSTPQSGSAGRSARYHERMVLV